MPVRSARQWRYPLLKLPRERAKMGKSENREILKMKLTTIREIYKDRDTYLDQEISVGGWIRSVRDSKTFGFIVLHDGTFFETLPDCIPRQNG